MRRLNVVAGIGVLALLGACSDGAVSTNNGSVTVNTTVIGGDLRNNAEAAGNFARNNAKAIGNGLSRAGEVISNNAKAAWNEIKETARDIGASEGQGEASGNSAGN